MKKMDVKKLAQSGLGAALMILFGVVLLLNPDFGSAAVATVLGWILIVCGGIGVLIGVFSWPGLGFGEFLGSLVLLGCGVFLLKSPLSLASVLGLMLGIFLAVQGISSVFRALRLRRQEGLWLPGLLLGALMLVLGLILAFSPMTTSRLVMSIVGIVLIACGIGSLANRRQEAKYLHGGDDSIIDADE